MRHVVFVVMTGATLAACTLLTSLDELSDGSPDSGLAPSEAGESATDAAAPLDATTEGAVEASVPFCKSQTGFAICADFDDTNAPPFPFDSVALNGASNTLAYDNGDFVSPARSLLMTGGPSTTGNTAAGLKWKTPIIATEVVADFDVKVEQLGTKPFDLLNFARSSYELSIELAPSGQLEFDSQVPDGDGGVIGGTVTLGATSNGKWQHIKWAAKKDTGNRFKIDISVDGVPVGSTTISQTLFLGQPAVEIGDVALEPSTTIWKLRMDNFVMRVK